jgi:hypothetical protein
MNNRKLMSEYYKDDGSVAKIYQVVTGMDGEHSFFSITYKDPDGNRIATEDFPFKALRYVEDAAENWTLGIKLLLG